MNEVEIKVRIADPDAIRIQQIFAEYGPRTLRETDIYYNSIHRDLIEPEECVRIRISSDFNEITWKPPTTEAMRSSGQFWKRELNLRIEGPIDPWRELLLRLDFEEYVIVEKERLYCSLDHETNAMMDVVKHIGTFVEIETFSDNYEYAIQKNRTILDTFGISAAEVISVPYRDLVHRVKQG